MKDSPLATSNTVPGNQSITPLGFLANPHVHIVAGWPTLMNTSWLPGQLAAAAGDWPERREPLSLPLTTMNTAWTSGMKTPKVQLAFPFPLNKLENVKNITIKTI